MRIPRAVQLASLAALAGGWALAVALLWRSPVPDDLAPPRLDPRAFFGERELERAADYRLFRDVSFLLSTLALLVALALYAWKGAAAFMRASAAGRIGTGMMLGMLGLGIVWLTQLPFQVADLWWQRRHGLSDAPYWEWLLDTWLALGVEFLFVCFALLVVMGLAARLPRLWWLPGAAVFVGLGALFVLVDPYVEVPSLERPADPQLVADAQAIARREGVPGVPLRVQDVSELTDAANAFATGLGPTRRVVLWSTMLDGSFSRDELRVVLAHEYAHQARGHLAKGIAWSALLALPGTWLIARATRRRGGMAEPAAVPLSLLVLVGLQFLALPVQNLVSRHLEAEADWLALETTGDPAAARGLFTRFAERDLEDPSPPTWSYLLLGSHPTLIQRIALTRAWSEEQRARSGRGPPSRAGS